MKKIMAIALLCFSSAFAGTVATAGNKDGGILVLTDVKCNGKSTMVAYTTASNGSTLLGCWFVDDNFVMIMWNDGDVRSYPYGIWTMRKQGQTY